jgi:methionyl-tRNA formyltransferase
MRIVYMGTPDFAVAPFLKLLDDGHEVVGVFTQPDKPQGRKMRMTPPPVKSAALERNIPVFQPNTFKDFAMEETLQNLNPDLIVVVAYGKLLPKYVLQIPPYGCINVHGSLLPKYRGAAPIQWSVIDGNTYAGITTMQMNEGLDTGDMLLQAKTEIGENETSGELYERLTNIGADLLSETIQRLESGLLTPKKQDEHLATYASMLNKEMAVIDWSKPAQTIHNQIRGLNPWPIAITMLDGNKFKIYASCKTEETAQAEPGTIVRSDAKKGLWVCCGDGRLLRLIELQAPGSKRMTAEAYLLGHQIAEGSVFGK